MNEYTIGIDVGGTKSAYGLFDSSHKIIARHQHPTENCGTCEDICDRIVKGIYDLLDEAGVCLDNVSGIGLAMPSYINFETGRIICTSNICNLKDFEAKQYFEAKLGKRVVLDNDCNAAALAEHRFGAGRGHKHMLYCAVSTGISNGIIINNELFRGSYGAAGETGHMLITPDEGVECGCGNKGCFMSWVSGSNIVKHVIHWIEAGGQTAMLEMASGDAEQIDGRIIEKCALSGDEMALKAIDTMAYYLGMWIFNTYQAYNINCYVFGGGLVKMGALLFDKAFDYFRKFNVTQPNDDIHFKFAELEHDFGIIGAEQLLVDPECVC